MHISLLATNYTSNVLVGFTFLDLIKRKPVFVKTDEVVPILKDNANLVYGLGLDKYSNFVGTCGKLDRYTKIVNGKINGVLKLVVIARREDTYLLSTVYGNLTTLNYYGIVDLLNNRGMVDGLSNARVSSKGFISPIRGNFYLGYNNLSTKTV